MFRIGNNSLFEWLFAGVLASHPGSLGKILGQGMTVSEPQVMILVKSLHKHKLLTRTYKPTLYIIMNLCLLEILFWAEVQQFSYGISNVNDLLEALAEERYKRRHLSSRSPHPLINLRKDQTSL